MSQLSKPFEVDNFFMESAFKPLFVTNGWTKQ